MRVAGQVRSRVSARSGCASKVVLVWSHVGCTGCVWACAVHDHEMRHMVRYERERAQDQVQDRGEVLPNFLQAHERARTSYTGMSLIWGTILNITVTSGVRYADVRRASRTLVLSSRTRSPSKTYSFNPSLETALFLSSLSSTSRDRSSCVATRPRGHQTHRTTRHGPRATRPVIFTPVRASWLKRTLPRILHPSCTHLAPILHPRGPRPP